MSRITLPSPRAAKPHQILKRAFQKKQLRQPAFSVRNLGRLLDVSPSYVSAIFSGKKPVPFERLAALAKILDIDDVAVDQIRNAALSSTLIKQTRALGLSASRLRQTLEPKTSGDYGQNLSVDSWVLDHWYYIAVLDLATCSDFRFSPDWVAERLRISVGAATETLDRLLGSGLLKWVDGEIKKTTRYQRVGTTSSQQKVRGFHRQLMQLAQRDLANQATAHEFASRLITSAVIAVNPEHIVQARQIMSDAIFRVSSLLSTGDCSQVYQLGVQLTPLTSTAPQGSPNPNK